MAGPQEHPEPGLSTLLSDPLHLPHSSLNAAYPQLLPCGEEARLTAAAMGESLN